MSTIDPNLARLNRKKWSPGPVALSVGLLLGLLAGFATGFGFPTLYSNGELDPPIAGTVSASLAIPLVIGASTLWTALMVKGKDVGFGPGMLFFFLGLGVGATVAKSQLGESVLAVIFTIIAVFFSLLFAVLTPIGMRARKKVAATRELILRTGIATTATISDTGFRPNIDADKVLAQVTFTFFDITGTQRWVQQAMFVDMRNPIVQGQETTLWYDPADPSDRHRIFVKLVIDNRN